MQHGSEMYLKNVGLAQNLHIETRELLRQDGGNSLTVKTYFLYAL